MSKMFSRSKSRLRSAIEELQRIADDDAALDGACFNLQQSLEFALKYLFECNGKKYPWGHSISDLIEELATIMVLPVEVSVFLDKGSLYTSWERDSRYLDSFVSSVKDAQECVSRLHCLHSFIDRNYSQIEGTEDEAVSWCKANAPAAMQNLPLEEMLEYMMPMYVKYAKKT